MSKARNTGNLNNAIKISDTGAITFVSGSTTLMAVSPTGQLSGSAPVMSASFAQTSTSSSYALNATSAVSATTATTASFATNFTVTGNLTAQTLVVQTITSSVDFVTGSTRFGSIAGNTHQFTGSVLLSSGSFLNVGRTDNGYPFTVGSQFAKTDTTGRGLAFFGSNEAYASNPFGLVITVTGASTLANRVVQMGTTDFGLANGGILSLQGTLHITGNNVGIGTTTPLSILDLRLATTDGVNGSVLNSYPIASFIINASGGGQRGLQLGGPTGGISSPVFLKVFGTGQRFAIINESNIENFTVTSAGNVGIGTPTPNYALTIKSTIGGANRVQLLPTTDYAFYQIDHSGGTTYIGTDNSTGGVFGNGNYAMTIYNSYAGAINMYTNATLRMAITSGGNVGIRTTNPRTILQVTPVSNGETPVLGTANGIATFTSSNTNYGLQLNSTSDGTFFMQSQRFDSISTAYALGLNPSGGVVYLGNGWGATAHRINLSVTQGSNVLVVSGYDSVGNDTAKFQAVSGTGGNGANTALWLATNNSTGRSLNAGGTINASGNDYAEYVEKAVTDAIAKGDIVGVNSDAKLTNIFADAISFAVKSTDPSYVGGDVWGNVVGKRPERTIDQTEEEFAPILAEFEAKLEAARATVDRIAFSGQVPCNVTGAIVGDYIIPIELEDGKIGGQAITNPSFDQFKSSVGKVWKIMEDGRAWIKIIN